MIDLDVISDPVCPWCYIGATNLFRALGPEAEQVFAIRWRPYQLNPDMPAEGMDRAAYLAAKFGGAEAAARVYARVETAAREVGLAIDFAAIPRAPNTLDAHRLVHWAAAEGAATRAKMALFRRYFEAGEDISDPAVLGAAAAEAGMDGDAVARRLAGDVDRDAVLNEARAAREMGVTGVPTFVIGGRHVLTGAQPAAVWRDVVDRIAAGAGA